MWWHICQVSPLGTSIQQVLRSAAMPRLGFASCRAQSCFLTKVPAEVLSPRGQGWSQPGRGSPGATASCTLQCCDHSAAALVEVRAGQEFSDATALMESARVKRKPLLLKKKKKWEQEKKPLWLCQNKTIPVWTCWLSCWLPQSSGADSGGGAPRSLLRIDVLDRRRGGWALGWCHR